MTESSSTFTPRETVGELDRYIIGQDKAKRAVAVALRNRWRRQQVPEDLRDEISPKNIIMIGPTGVGKTEIARRLAKLAKAPFMKVEASKFTEVGYVGRDVESIVRDLVDISIKLVREERIKGVQVRAKERAEQRLVEALVNVRLEKRNNEQGGDGQGGEGPSPDADPVGSGAEAVASSSASSPASTPGTPAANAAQADPNNPFGQIMNAIGQAASSAGFTPGPQGSGVMGSFGPFVVNATPVSPKGAPTPSQPPAPELPKELVDEVRAQLRNGELEEEVIEVEVADQGTPMVTMFGQGGMEEMELNIRDMMGNLPGMKDRTRIREIKIKDARDLLEHEEAQKLIDMDDVQQEAVKRAEQSGIVFIDEIDKVAAPQTKGSPDVSREGVQRDLLPIVEGSTVNTKHGPVKTDHILFIAAGAFHVSSVSDLIPELQGRFPIRVELESLGKKEFVRILTEPRTALTKQYTALMATEGVALTVDDEAIEAIATYATEANERAENIGARRLHTIMEALLEELSFSAPERTDPNYHVDRKAVEDTLSPILASEDLAKYIL